MNASHWIAGNAPGFAALSRGERVAIRDFALLWSVFEGRHVQADEANFDTIKATAAQAFGTTANGAGDLRDQFAYFAQRYPTAPGSTQRLNALMNNRSPAMQAYIVDGLRGDKSQSHEIAGALLLIAFRLRNNLFHGTKWGGLMIDQMRNFRTAGRVLIITMNRQPHLHAV